MTLATPCAHASDPQQLAQKLTAFRGQVAEREQRTILRAGEGNRDDPRNNRIAVSDRETFGGLTQFLTQFGFSGSSTDP